jgi:hypothetical protein
VYDAQLDIAEMSVIRAFENILYILVALAQLTGDETNRYV